MSHSVSHDVRRFTGVLLVACAAGSPSVAGAQSSFRASQLAAEAARAAAANDSAQSIIAAGLWARAADLYRLDGRREEQGDALYNAGEQYIAAKWIDSALVFYRRALPVLQKVNSLAGQAATLSNIGLLMGARGEPDSAMLYQRQALAFRIQVGNNEGTFTSVREIANAQVTAAIRPESALVYFREAIAALDSVRPAREEERRYILGGKEMLFTRVAYSSLDLSRYDSAFAYLHRAVTMAQAAGDLDSEASGYNTIAGVYNDLGRPDSALAFFDRALPIVQKVGNHPAEGMVLNNMGVAFNRMDQADTALVLFRRAYGLIGTDPDSGAAELNNIGTLLLDRGKVDSALVYHRRALTQYRAAKVRHSQPDVLSSIGSDYLNAGRLDSAARFFRWALALSDSIGEPDLRGHPLFGLGILNAKFSQTRNLRTAVAYFDSAGALFANAVRHTGSDANTISAREGWSSGPELWALAWLGRATEAEVGPERAARAALAVAERGRAQALMDLIAHGKSTAPAPGKDLVAESDSLLEPLRRSGVGLLSYLVTRDTLLTWLMLPGGALQVAHPRAINRDTLGGLVARLRRALGVDSARMRMARAGRAPLDQQASHGVEVEADTSALLDTLSKLLVPPELLAAPAGTEIVIVPNQTLNLVPFAALPIGDKQHLGSRFALRYSPSLGLIARIGTDVSDAPRSSAARRTALVVGNPAMPWVHDERGDSAQLKPLPGADVEAREIAGLLGVTPLTGDSATEVEVRRRVGQSTIVHLATHGLAFGSERRARDSYVALAPDAQHDGLLTVGELLDDSGLSLNADLVVLSACQTGLGDLKQAEGTVGLQRAFLAKGARTVLVSLWSVDDEATRFLMERFYAYWRGGRQATSKAEALRLAQNDVRGNPAWTSPAYWAAFQLVGSR